MSVLFEGHKVTASTTVGGTLVDHTFVVTELGSFSCWGGTSGPDDQVVCDGYGNYYAANCYRGNNDSACVGIYGINGVCHQATNCFLYSADITLDLSVKGYYVSSYLYGPYGTNYDTWRQNFYAICYASNNDKSLFDNLKGIYKTAIQETFTSKNEYIVRSSVTLAKHILPDIETAKLEKLHYEFLPEIQKTLEEAEVENNMIKEDSAKKINAKAIQLQEELATKLTPEEYKSLIGVEPGIPIHVINLENIK